MKFNARELKSQGFLEQSSEFNPLTLLGDPPSSVQYRQQVYVSAKAQLVGIDVLVEGYAHSILYFECVRCLENFEYDVKASIRQTYKFEDIDLILDSEIREAFLLEIPLNPTCKSDCEGLCKNCGVNKNKQKCSCTDVNIKPSKFADLNWQI